MNAYNYVTHMLMVSRQVLSQVELSPADVSGAQDYDLTLKCCEKARSIANVPYMLYHWRVHQNSTSTNPDSKPYAQTAGKIVLQRHFERTGLQVDVSDSELPFRYRNRYINEATPKVSIVIPTKDHSQLLQRCLTSVLEKTTYQNYDITLVENNSTEQETFAYYDRIQDQNEKIKVVTWPGTGFNYSAICNYGAAHCDGEILLFLNNDTVIINGDWLDSMVGFFARPEVGIVGAKLLFPDNLVQHGGVWVSADHVGYLSDMLSDKDGGYMETMRYPYNCAAVTGACQMVRRKAFQSVGGFDENLAVVLNDVDLCLKIGQQGYLTVFDPQAKLYHSEHTSRGRDEQDVEKERRAIDEQARFYARWDKTLVGARGKYINRQLNQYDGHYKIRW
ncbi:glycosyltransferase family 2 protein [Bifidobacterium ruminantium]|uniref:glycosyltransferase family 2 protein n=1 Tax=Bifidobacterium ruminantium TaxID=78346 RepID=UPI0009DFD1A9